METCLTFSQKKKRNNGNELGKCLREKKKNKEQAMKYPLLQKCRGRNFQLIMNCRLVVNTLYL